LSESAPLELTAALVRGEPIGYEDAMRLDYGPMRVGDEWGPPWSTTWIHVRGRVPDGWREKRVVALFDLGFIGDTGFTCEALAWKDGRPWRGVDPNHRWLPIDGPEVDFYLEAAANAGVTLSGRLPALSMLELRQSPNAIFTLNQAELQLFEPSAPAGKPSLGAHAITAVGHAHIDTAWLWPLRETKRKCARSWSSTLELMDAHPDYVFACSQPAQYAWMKESYPDIHRRIKERVASGQWEPVGGMWVEADCNLPSGEALVRQLLHGQRFFKEEFGSETRIVWLPDVFGYPGNLPQLIKEAGCDYFLTQKLSWNDTNKPEHHTFWWEGIDGTRVFTHFPPADTYNGDFSVDELERSVANFKDADVSNRSLYPFGYGDGGGGPTAEEIEAAHAFGIPMGKATEWFDQASSEAGDLAVVKGELYFEFHRGTYTTQARTKQLNRRAQESLRQAEMWSVAAGDYPREELDALWKKLLLNQFHDILPGSSIDWVYAEAERDLGEVIAGAEAIIRRTARHHAESAKALTAAAQGPSIESDSLRVELGDDGVITSIWDKEAQREVLSGPGNVLELHEDLPRRWDAWDIDIESRDAFSVVGRRFGDSSVRQTISVEGRVIRFDTEVEWHERHKLLKVAFPVAVEADEATYEVQFGHVRRPTHMITPKARAMFEVCAQRWADLGDGAYGVALLNDCKHGYDIHDGVMRLSLLRSPTHPDPNADQGRHHFSYALMPHIGEFRTAGVIEAAAAMNSVFGAPPGLVSVDTPQVRVEAIKLAEDSNAVIVRLYEAWGRPCTARITTTLGARRATLCDLLEGEKEETDMNIAFRPFQVVTLKLEP
jgi:alpha-mannosidase